MDRRQALQIATGAVSLVAFQANAAEKAATASAAVAGRTPEDVARDEDYWTEIRNAFTVDRNVINFNNGYASPAPIPVQDAMRRYLSYSDMGPIQTMVNVLYPQIERVRVYWERWMARWPTVATLATTNFTGPAAAMTAFARVFAAERQHVVGSGV